MNENVVSIAAGGLLRKKNQILLVQVTYGPNKGLWMLPGGYLEAGESIEEAAIREVARFVVLRGRPSSDLRHVGSSGTT